MVDEELAFTPATELLELIATKQVSPVELTQLYYSRIDRLDSSLNSYLLLTRESAIKEARAAEEAVMRGDQLGALHGLPIAIKDTQMTKGVRTTNGSLLFKDRIPDKDSAVVESIQEAGGIMLGKTNAPEFGLVGTCENRLGDHGRNPWNTDRTPGGSSGGAAAAMAACLCPLAAGGDGGGSIRIPASFCGIYGIKATQGRASGYNGMEPVVPNHFGQQGPLSRTVKDSALLLKVISGHDPRDPTSMREPVPDFVGAVDKDIQGLRVAWSPDYGFAAVDPEVLEVTSKASQVFEELGCHLEESDLGYGQPIRCLRADIRDQCLRPVRRLRREPWGLDDPVRSRLHRVGVEGVRRRFGESDRPHRQAQGPDDRPFREVRSVAVSHIGTTRHPRRRVPRGDRGSARVPPPLFQLPSFHLPDQCNRAHRCQHPCRVFLRRAAHWPSDRREEGRRGDGHSRVGRLREGKAVDTAQAPGVLTARKSCRYIRSTSWT